MMRQPSGSGRAVLAVACLAAPALAAQSPPAGPAACAAAEHRQFDFWIGEWDVHTPDGKLAGTNRIERILGGCGLRESWRGASGVEGTSLNAYDPADARWHQTWIDAQGTVLHLSGALQQGRMVLEGTLPSPRDRSRQARQRITWERRPDGRVRQLWESSEDGAAWNVVFDGLYSRKQPAGPPG